VLYWTTILLPSRILGQEGIQRPLGIWLHGLTGGMEAQPSSQGLQLHKSGHLPLRSMVGVYSRILHSFI